jgi:hypothetical protein
MAGARSSILYLLSSILALALAGCEVKQPPRLEPVIHAPLVLDEAMRHRQWPVSVAHYGNGETVAWPTGAIFRHRADEPVWQGAITDTPIFVANAVTIPVVYLFTPPWQPVVYPSGEVEASYHVMPPMR